MEMRFELYFLEENIGSKGVSETRTFGPPPETKRCDPKFGPNLHPRKVLNESDCALGGSLFMRPLLLARPQVCPPGALFVF